MHNTRNTRRFVGCFEKIYTVYMWGDKNESRDGEMGMQLMARRRWTLFGRILRIDHRTSTNCCYMGTTERTNNEDDDHTFWCRQLASQHEWVLNQSQILVTQAFSPTCKTKCSSRGNRKLSKLSDLLLGCDLTLGGLENNSTPNSQCSWQSM